MISSQRTEWRALSILSTSTFSKNEFCSHLNKDSKSRQCAFFNVFLVFLPSVLIVDSVDTDSTGRWVGRMLRNKGTKVELSQPSSCAMHLSYLALRLPPESPSRQICSMWYWHLLTWPWTCPHFNDASWCFRRSHFGFTVHPQCHSSAWPFFVPKCHVTEPNHLSEWLSLLSCMC